MYTIAKYDSTEGCAGDLAYYVFKGEHETLRAAAGSIDLPKLATVPSEMEADQIIAKDAAEMAYEGWVPHRKIPARAGFHSQELVSIVSCINKFAD